MANFQLYWKFFNFELTWTYFEWDLIRLSICGNEFKNSIHVKSDIVETMYYSTIVCQNLCQWKIQQEQWIV